MKTWRIAVISLWLISCTLTTAGTSPDGGSEQPDWIDIMNDVDAACEDLERWLLHKPRGDLTRTADRAAAASRLIRLGYGEFEHKEVPGFARFARNAESWFVQIALEARQGHDDIAADLFRSGKKQHCSQCHDAFDAVE